MKLALPLAVAAIWCGLILFVHRDSPRTLVSAHGLLHAAIAEEFADPETRPPLATPPENPLFAGTPLPYYYFFHATGAQLARLLGIDVIHAFEILVVVAAAGVVLLGFVLGRVIHGHPKEGLLYGIAFAVLFFAGCNPQGPFVLLARWWKDGGAALEDRGQYLWGLVHPINGAMRIGDYWGALGPLASFFFNVTARPLALASLVLLFVMLAPALKSSQPARPLALLGVALAAALCALWSPLLGLASAGALAAVLVLQSVVFERRSVVERRRARIKQLKTVPLDVEAKLDRMLLRMRRGRFLVAGALLAGAALAWPWYRHLLGAESERVQFGFNAKRALGILASGWLVLFLALGQPRSLLADASDLPQMFLRAGVLLTIPTAFVALPVGNEDNFFHAALVCFAAVAASSAVPDPVIPPEPPPGGG